MRVGREHRERVEKVGEEVEVGREGQGQDVYPNVGSFQERAGGDLNEPLFSQSTLRFLSESHECPFCTSRGASVETPTSSPQPFLPDQISSPPPTPSPPEHRLAAH